MAQSLNGFELIAIHDGSLGDARSIVWRFNHLRIGRLSDDTNLRSAGQLEPLSVSGSGNLVQTAASRRPAAPAVPCAVVGRVGPGRAAVDPMWLAGTRRGAGPWSSRQGCCFHRAATRRRNRGRVDAQGLGRPGRSGPMPLLPMSLALTTGLGRWWTVTRPIFLCNSQLVGWCPRRRGEWISAPIGVVTDACLSCAS